MGSIVYRPMVPPDASRVSSLIKETFGEFVAPGYSAEGVNVFLDYIQPERFQQRHQNDHFTIVAVDDTALVGVIHIRQHKHISLMFVLTPYQRRGIARHLLGLAEVRCKTQSITELTVHSSPFAVPVYLALGFRATGDRATENGICYVPMTKIIS